MWNKGFYQEFSPGKIWRGLSKEEEKSRSDGDNSVSDKKHSTKVDQNTLDTLLLREKRLEQLYLLVIAWQLRSERRRNKSKPSARNMLGLRNKIHDSLRKAIRLCLSTWTAKSSLNGAGGGIVSSHPQ
jgi:hypothetical protein